jgi:hypothetical protein
VALLTGRMDETLSRPRRHFIPLLMVRSRRYILSITIDEWYVNTGMPCDEVGNDRNPETLQSPQRPRTDHPQDWTPFKDQLSFETAELLFIKNQMPATQIDALFKLWAASLLKYGDSGPFEDHKDLYNTIDSIPLGDVAWETFDMSYCGERPQHDVPEWMDAKYHVWFRDPRTIVRNLISNPDFDGEFDYAPFQEYDRSRNHRFCDFMSGDWAWKQAVGPFARFAVRPITFVLQY